MKQFLLVLCIVLSCASLGAQSTKGKPVPIPSSDPGKVEYVIGLEDVLAITVWKEPDLSLKEVVVRPDGRISLPLINDIQADGLTPQQLQDRIAKKLQEFIASPNVTVSVVKLVSQSVSVIGQVNRPGAYAFGSPITVVEVLARAGGLTEYAKAKDIRVIRTQDGKTQQFRVNYKEIVKGNNLQQNILLKKGDVVMVP